MKVNFEKTECIWISANAGRAPCYLPVKWQTSDFFTLGIKFISDEYNMSSNNFDGKFGSMQDILNIWKMRDLSFIGKVLVVKSLGISKLVYSASTVPLFPDMIKKVQKEINKFIWGSNIPKVKSDVMFQKPENGGLKVTNFLIKVKSLLITWVKRILKEDNARWKHVIQEFFPGVSLIDLFRSRCCIGAIWTSIPLFYKQLLKHGMNSNHFSTYYKYTNS